MTTNYTNFTNSSMRNDLVRSDKLVKLVKFVVVFYLRNLYQVTINLCVSVSLCSILYQVILIIT